MAYLKELRRECATAYCKKRALVSLFTRRNEHWQDYCRQHGKYELRVLKKTEGQPP